MKTRHIFSALIVALSCARADAQVLGGNVAGGLGGVASGGMRDAGFMTQGGGRGALGADLDAGGLRRTTSDVGGRVVDRSHRTLNNTRDRTGDAVNGAREHGATAAGAASANANAASRQTEVAGTVAGSAASQANVARNQIGGSAGSAAAATQTAAAERVPKLDPGSVSRTAANSDASSNLDALAGPRGTVRPSGRIGSNTEHSANLNDDTIGGELTQGASAQGTTRGITRRSSATAGGEGSASAGASMSKSKPAANAAADAGGNSNMSIQR